MGRKLAPAQIVGIAALAIFTVFITWKAKALEKRMHERGEPSALVNKPAADFTLPSLGGQQVSLTDYRGKKKVVLSFWASWCGPCRRELPVLADFYRKYHKDSSDFEILAISIDDDREAAEAYAAKAKLPFPVLLDPDSKAADLYSVDGIPTLFIVDTKGTIIEGDTGMNPGIEVQLMVRLGIKSARNTPEVLDDSSH
ncbi:MAG TPA: TlpA disulfide reductase family protein [Methylomirabilota bacterium]|nr:TlpA disulfide reductase family protein [Methylomirabilota bacterium]